MQQRVSTADRHAGMHEASPPVCCMRSSALGSTGASTNGALSTCCPCRSAGSTCRETGCAQASCLPRMSACLPHCQCSQPQPGTAARPCRSSLAPQPQHAHCSERGVAHQKHLPRREQLVEDVCLPGLLVVVPEQGVPLGPAPACQALQPACRDTAAQLKGQTHSSCEVQQTQPTDDQLIRLHSPRHATPSWSHQAPH
jgi:hypothetical protein